MQTTHVRRLLRAEPTLRFAPTHTDPTAHAAWSRRVRAVVERLARVERAPLDITAVDTRDETGLRREHLTLNSPVRGAFQATLLAPADRTEAAPGPAVLVFGGKNARLEHLTGERPPDFPDRNIAEHLARAGFVTLTFEHGIGGLDDERRAGREEGALLAHVFALTGRSLLGALVGDTLGALDVLTAHPLVDADRVGLFGHSLGAAVALHTALLTPRPLPVCAASHLGSYPALFERLLTGYEGAVLPGILEYADLGDLYAALAPTPLHLQYGTADSYLEPADARAAAATVRGGYAAADAGDHLDVHELPMGHGTHVRHTIDFFTRTLSGPAAAPGDVPAQRIHFGVAERRAVLDRVDTALASGHLTQGPGLARFEELCRAWTGREGVAVASGAAALEIALRIVGVAGRTVLVPVNTFFATAAAAVRAGARVRFVDIELDGLGLDPDALRTALDRHPDTAAVLPVHIGGIVAPTLDDVLALCERRGVAVVEDAAHALGATLGGRYAGAFGRFGAFSFFPTKVAVSGEGGLVSCANAEDAEQVRRWRDHGKSAQGSTLHDRPGGNWRLSELHAAVGTVDLERFDETLAARRDLAFGYDELLADVPGVRAHTVPAAAHSNYYKYLAYLDAPVDRALLKKRLRERHGVSLAGEVYDHLLCDQPYFAATAESAAVVAGSGVGTGASGAVGSGTTVGDCAATADSAAVEASGAAADGPFEQARWFARHHIALPLYPTLTRAEQFRVVEALRGELS
ncbi:DegT/DnrJ/EryC1/StrS aminotransferase [Streptomyces alboflavus]|uniref:DegT/DnrJ/EryC1/StrS aminotransferase n=1 Tax=Streptomyces alboflavus TaxID=67267 RepID=A0A1Z1WMN4_9ACTN|nr:aminotransferase class I/II-fold pyridoxal phosphate-dependent enzyme [Streptomyces alboflavus]ARX87704.1 DegT/DnrJ/EryC1/StrS aminotransferase [Streptomyces alboflavus]